MFPEEGQNNIFSIQLMNYFSKDGEKYTSTEALLVAKEDVVIIFLKAWQPVTNLVITVMVYKEAGKKFQK